MTRKIAQIDPGDHNVTQVTAITRLLQVTAMEHYYTNVSRYARPDNGLPELIRETGLTHDTIMLWFQNKRARDKRKGWDDVGGGNDGKRPKTE